MRRVLQWLLDNWGLVAGAVALFVQITPIVKAKPITKLLKWIGSAVNGDVMKRLDGLEQRADEQRKSIDENEMDRIRWEVLDFANACRNKRRHTKDEFEHIIELNAKYHKLLKKHDATNGVFDAEYDYINTLYKQCQRNNDFL